MKGQLTPQRLLMVVLALAVFAAAAWALIKFGPSGRTPSRLTFLISGKTEGFLENCGCSGGQSGGVHRRATMIRTKREEVMKPIVSDDGHSSDVVTIDVGDFSDSSDGTQIIRSQGIVKSMEMIGYDAVGLGQNELTFDQKQLLDLLTQGTDIPYACANLRFVKPDSGEDHSAELAKLVAPYRIARGSRGYKVGIIHVLDNSSILRGEPIKSGYEVDNPVAVIANVLKEHGREAQFWVLSVGTNEQFGLRNEKLADFDQIKLVFGMRGYQPEGGSEGVAFPYFVDKPMEKGKDVTVVGVTFAEDKQLRVTAMKVGIREDSYKPAKDVQKMIADLKPLFEAEEEKKAEDELNKFKDDPNTNHYVGFTHCATCHQEIALQMRDTGHMHAYETLRKQGRQHDVCAKCHNNGFNKPGGFNVHDDKLITGEWVQRNVQCETCHGPGEFHVKLKANPPQITANDPRLKENGLDKQALVPVNRDTCVDCHNPENSPYFDFDKYWPYIQHGKGRKPKEGHPEGAGMGPQSNPAMDGNETSLSLRRDRVIASVHALL
jgi:hypothetical protein